MHKINTVILDRDGVINNDSDEYIKSANEFTIINGVIDALYNLHKKNIQIFIVTNQSGINRRLYDIETHLIINKKLLDAIKNHSDYKNQKLITAIYYCPHLPNEYCTCRKPLPGMLQQIQKHYDIDLNSTAVVGDSLRDLEAADAAGCKYKFLVKTGKGAATLAKSQLPSNIVFDNLAACVDHLININ